MPTPRNARLADQIQEIIARMLQRRVKDPRLGFVTITDVRLTPDNRDATVFYTVLGDHADAAGTAVALESAKGLLRSTVAKQLGLRFAPTITFVPDASAETAREIEEALGRAAESDLAAAERARGAQFAGEEDPYRKPREESADEDDTQDDTEE